MNLEKFEPHILCMHERGEYYNVVKKSNIPVHIGTYTTSMRPIFEGLIKCWRISRKLKAIGAEIIHSFHYSADYSEALAARLAGIRWIYTKKNMNWGGSSRNAWNLRSFLASRIVAQNSSMINTFFKGSHKVVLIPRGLNEQEFLSIEREISTDGVFRLLTVANLTPVKRVETILFALSKLKASGIFITFHIVGDNGTDYGRYLEQQVKFLDISDVVEFFGKQFNPKDFYRKADVFILSSLKESSPVALLEAMAAGVPVLSSRTAGALEIMGDFEDQLFLIDDVNFLIDRILWIFQLTTEEKAQLISRQRERILTHHTIALEVERHEELYRTITR
ncbi:MAG: glycosyltransferase family 4 protein [Cyclobacteriaceae bacterium]|nr:glycosyltransferase family 4 protein [Cyclobacteriaceae bacterium]